MKLDISLHKTVLFQILKAIYTDAAISPFLGFKGGTAALMFHGLDRFSVDLDFACSMKTGRIPFSKKRRKSFNNTAKLKNSL
ncbi:MAG: hypothetical protein KPEEDBHJ_00254 [Anaerolineales bacterium]|nr:hypothetical protein [Anaerolineales bacterium]